MMPVEVPDFNSRQIIARYGFLEARLALRRAVERDEAHADGGIGFFNFGRCRRCDC